jgi:hypothetical protein
VSFLAHGDAASGAGALNAAVLVLWVPVFFVWRLLDRRRTTNRLTKPMAAVAAWATLVAGLIHFIVVPEHWQESSLYGTFFAAATVAQVGLAVLLAQRSAAWLLVGNIAVQLGLVGLWAVTRTAGIPLGPEAGMVEAVGLLDSLCVAAQVLSAAACAVLLRYGTASGTSAGRRNALAANG